MSKHSSTESITAWFGQRLPQEWTAAAAPSVVVDREEITVTVTLPTPEGTAEATEAERAAAAEGLVARWRAETKAARIDIAREAEHRYRRKIAWAARVGEPGSAGEYVEVFTHLAVPVMTRLRQPERVVLDTLVEAGVARSRAHALAWCVHLVGENTEGWLGDLRSAMENVAKIRAAGPGADLGAHAAGEPEE